MRITYLYQPGRIARLPKIRNGELPTEFFYGAPQLEEMGHSVSYLEVHDVPTEGLTRVALEKLVKRQLLPAKVYFSLIYGVKALLPALQGADVIVATTPGIAFSLALLKHINLAGKQRLSAEIVAIHCGVLNYPQNSLRVAGSRWLFKKMWTMLFGIGEQEGMVNCFQIPPHRIQVNAFGVDEAFWRPSTEGSEGENYLLAIGNDSNRDYELLLAAAAKIEHKIKLVTRRQLPDTLPPNVEHLYGSWHTQALDDQGLRRLYQQALGVIVPLKDSVQPSGQSVTLQAMACGTPVILTKTLGLWERTALRNKENVLFIDPGSVEGLVDAVSLIVNDHSLHKRLSQAGPQYVEKNGKIAHFAQRVEALCLHAVREMKNA